MVRGVMKAAAGALAAMGVLGSAVTAGEPGVCIYDYKMKDIDGKMVDLSEYKGKVILVVNVASKCGLTPQYEGLEAIYEKYKDKGFVVLGFPANEFGKQEPGTDSEIKKFCSATYDVTFPMFSKVVVKGEGICPLYQALTSKETNGAFGGEIPWNFTKFLVGKDGHVIARFEPMVTPDNEKVTKTIEAALAK
jgi:glutathione peroxidase